MALTATARGTGSRNTGGETTYVISPTSDIAANTRAVLCLSVDNSGTSGAAPLTVTSVTDSLGNWWTRQAQQTNNGGGVANAGIVAAIYDVYITKPITTSDTITVTFTTTTVARAYTLWEVASSTAGMLPCPNHCLSSAVGGTSTTPTVTTEKTMVTDELIIGVIAAEYGDGSITEDADTTNGSWSTSQEASVGTTTSGVEICSQYKVVTGNGTQTYNATITSADWVPCYITYKEASVAARNIGTGSRNTGSESTYAITPNQQINAGEFAVLAVSYDNSGTSGADPYSSIADSLGNQWYAHTSVLRDPGAANAGIAMRVFYSRLTRTLTTSDTITVTYSATTVARAYALWALDAANGYRVGFFGNSSEATGASTAPSVTRAAGNTAGWLMLGVMGAEHNSAITGSNDTTQGSWSANSSAGVGTTTSGAQINTQTKYITADASITYANTITSADWCIQVVLFGAYPIPSMLSSLGAT